ncbi:MAG TPA: O-antigen ligase family protein, partial [Chondromyces sp.]|nr:O-antigen ligase family protein [Chondromyces sp.]
MKEVQERYQYVVAAVLLVILALVIPKSVVGLGVTGILALLAIWRPKDMILSLLLYFPMRSFLIEINPSLKLAGDLIILAAFLRVVWDYRNNWKELFRFRLFEWGFFAFLAIGSISALITGVSIAAIIFQLRAFVITYIAYYVVSRLNITKQDVIRFLWITLWTALILSIQGIVEKVSQRTLLMPESWVYRSLSPNNRSRIYGLINNPNMLALFLSFAFFCTLYLRGLVKGKVKWFVTFALILMMGVWTLTYSRGTMIGFGLAFLFYLVLTRNWKRMIQTAVILISAFVLVNMPVSALTRYMAENHEVELPQPPSDVELDEEDEEEKESFEKKRLKETFEQSTIELSRQTGRLFIVEKGFEIFKDHPIVGTGFATYGDSATKSYSSPIYDDYDIEFDIYADNQYIQVIAQTGILGVITFAIFLLGMMFLLWKNRDRSPFAVVLMSALFGAFAC